MTTQAIVLAEAEPEAQSVVTPVVDTVERAPYRMTVPLCLAAGWGALLTFSAVFLFDEAKIGRAAAAPERLALAETASFEGPTASIRPIVATVVDEPDQAASVPLPPAKPKGLAGVKTAALTTTDTPDTPPRADRGTIRPDYAGTWGPTAAACGSKSRRRGYLPATITEDSATAGRTQCHFRNGRRDGVAWTVAADCAERGRRWTSQVRLVVDGDRLTWSSAKGSAFYVRCGRRDG